MSDELNMRYGRFWIDRDLLTKHPTVYSKVFRELGFVPTRVEADAMANRIYYMGYSHKFEKRREGDVVPDYEVVVTVSTEPRLESVEVSPPMIMESRPVLPKVEVNI